MKELGANTIRVYHADADGDHSGCMEAFAENGIYLFVDLDTFNTQINQVSLRGMRGEDGVWCSRSA
jgi:1,3-beta-glucanosyltransferase GAS1